MIALSKIDELATVGVYFHLELQQKRTMNEST